MLCTHISLRFSKKITRIKYQCFAPFTETSNGMEYHDDEISVVSLLLVTSSSMSPSQKLSLFIYNSKDSKLILYVLSTVNSWHPTRGRQPRLSVRQYDG